MKLDRRRKYYLILDCETATVPFAQKLNATNKQKIAIAKPLIYDLGWVICDSKGNIYKKENYLISEIFCVPSIFNTAYYAEKRPIYIKMLNNNEIECVPWRIATQKLIQDLQLVDSVGAYNAMFDFKKAIPFTENYIDAVYSNNYEKWEKKQKQSIEKILAGQSVQNPNFDKYNFWFKNKNYPIFDLWGLACKYLLNNNRYRKFCKDNGYFSSSGAYYSTTAENCYRYLTKERGFIEAHTALDDAEIETQIFAKIFKRSGAKFEKEIIYFPFRMLGKVAL